LDIVGDGPDRPLLEQEIARIGLNARVRVRGFVSHEDLPNIFRSLDIVCVPSLPTPRWIEQFGRVAVEAMASGVPVVASNVGSLPEVVGDAGILLPPGDSDALADALRRLADQPCLRATMSRLGRERAELYSWSNIAKVHQDVYLDC
jgi:glycosyltransferase involved in cell wall biosynthesis